MDTEKLKMLSDTELEILHETVHKLIDSRKGEKPTVIIKEIPANTRLVRLDEELAKAEKVYSDQENWRYNGGWAKTVTGLDKTHTNGYSILGVFIDNLVNLPIGSLIIDNSIHGSRKSHNPIYYLYRITELGLVLLEKSSGKTWAVDLWAAIEKNLK